MCYKLTRHIHVLLIFFSKIFNKDIWHIFQCLYEVPWGFKYKCCVCVPRRNQLMTTSHDDTEYKAWVAVVRGMHVYSVTDRFINRLQFDKSMQTPTFALTWINSWSLIDNRHIISLSEMGILIWQKRVQCLVYIRCCSVSLTELDTWFKSV